MFCGTPAPWSRTVITAELAFIDAFEFDFNLRAFGRVLHRIANHVLDGASQQLFITDDSTALTRCEFHRTLAAARFEVSIARDLAHQQRQVKFGFQDFVRAAFQPGQRE